MRVIVYALGKIYEREKAQIDWSQIIALADKTEHRETGGNGLPVISPDLLCGMEYDYIAIFSNQYYEEIRMELVGEYSVPYNKIIPWTEIVKGERKSAWQAVKLYQTFLADKSCKKILDVGMSVLSDYFLTKEQFLSGEDVVLDGIRGGRAITNDCLYDAVFEEWGECRGAYNAVLAGTDWQEISAGLDAAAKGKITARYLVFHTGYLRQGASVRDELDGILRKYGQVSCISNLWGILWIVDTCDVQEGDFGDSICIYSVVHKKYNVLSDKLYAALCVGGFQREGGLTEQAGENIAYLNPKINECTALYWIWKNANEDYVGLSHYRRFFYNNEIRSADNYLDKRHALEILKEKGYDIILTKVSPMEDMTVYEQIYHSIDHEVCEKGHDAVRRGIERRQPEYLQAFDEVMSGHNAFLCNMFVARREILDRYCEWLFSFLIEAAEETDVKGCDGYSCRVIGFFAERMWTVWLRKNKLKVKELPYVLVK